MITQNGTLSYESLNLFLNANNVKLNNDDLKRIISRLDVDKNGIVTIEDFVEEIVGDINDEYDEYDNKKISIISENVILADGLAEINDINDKLDVNLSNERFNTIGGFVTGELGKFPLKGDTLIYNDIIEFVVESAGKNKVEKVKISKL